MANIPSPLPTPCTTFLRSLEGLLEDEFGDASAPAYVDERSLVDAETADSLENDTAYWGRLYSALYYDDVRGEAPETVQEEWKEYAKYYSRHGKSPITDFKAHHDLMKDRLERRRKAREEREKKKAAAPPPRAPVPSSTTTTTSAPKRTPAPKPPAVDDETMFASVPAVLTVEVAPTLLILDKIDTVLKSFESHKVVTMSPVAAEDAKAIVAVYDYMIDVFYATRYKRKYGYNKQDHQSPKLVAGGDVPSYFANVKDQSIHRRKVLSMAGLRNLILFGTQVYQEMKDRLFVGDPTAYSGDVGINKMKRVTGSVVDLDTTVLRCSDRATLNALNEYVKVQKMKPFANSEELGNSPLAAEIAINTATDIMTRFAAEFSLNEEQMKQRKIHPSLCQTPIPKATSNTDRGKWPVWRYTNVGVDSFHANVPTMEEVNGALLKAPYHCAKYFLQLHALFPAEELEARLDAFFEDCVADTCFNQKWRSIEEFGHKIEHEGTIVDVLQKTQSVNQHVFTAELFKTDDAENTKEIAAMVEVCKGKMGKDKTGLVREITVQDITMWVHDPAVVI